MSQSQQKAVNNHKEHASVKISGSGVAQVDSNTVVHSNTGKTQLKALKTIRLAIKRL